MLVIEWLTIATGVIQLLSRGSIISLAGIDRGHHRPGVQLRRGQGVVHGPKGRSSAPDAGLSTSGA
ncbi:hypothetical protein ACFWXO_15765 [Kitasatospora sp. NPDC059088]|uniref:hypothetical protein n=1 Tax=Kitasatospora sp. NPDC059088 TaxID=3346722 RepID=UPI003691343C